MARMAIFFAALWTILCFCLRVEGQTVFAHFMIGNTLEYTMDDFRDDIRLAKEAHIDGFALNVAANEEGNERSLDMMFEASDALGFKLIFSFDYAGNGPWDKEDVIFHIDYYSRKPSYFRHHGTQPLVSTFEGAKPEEYVDWHDIRQRTGAFFMPSFSSLGAKKAMATKVVDGLFSWGAWPEGPNDMYTEVDDSYKYFLNGTGPYMMPVSPWFYTNLPKYSKNWLWRGDDLWYTRWNQVWYEKPEYVQIISWNDYGESHHIGPVRTKALMAFDGAPHNYALDRPHDAWRQFLPYVIDRYKGGNPVISKEGLQVWYRLNPGRACSTGGTTGNVASHHQTVGNPSDFAQDKVFFSALLGQQYSYRVKIGDSPWTTGQWDFLPDNKIGLYHASVPFNGYTGDVTVEITRGSEVIITLKGKPITTNCPNNYNPWVGGAWSPKSISATPVALSEQVCVAGTGKGDLKKLCEFACSQDYCPPGPCTCNFMGRRLPAPTKTATPGFPNPGKDCTYLGLCDMACYFNVCPAEACNRDIQNKGKCVVPTDPPEPSTTSDAPIATPTSSVDPNSINSYRDIRWSNAGNCQIFNPPRSEDTRLQCWNFCQVELQPLIDAGKTTSYGCVAFVPLEEELTFVKYPSTDIYYIMGKCSCDNQFVNLIADMVLEALPAIAQIGCFIVMSSLKLIFEIGLNAIPGVGEGINAGMKALIYAAKLLSYAYDASQMPEDAFDFWLSPCGGVQYVPEELRQAFDILSSVADGLVDFKPPKNIGKGSGQKGDSANPDRDRALPSPSPSGNPNSQQPTVTVTKITKSTVKMTTTITRSCDAEKFPQPCFHYYSALQNYPWMRTQLGCGDSQKAADGLLAIQRWKAQHDNSVWKAYTREAWRRGDGVIEQAPYQCDRDEFPPAYFYNKAWGQDLKANKGQVVRWLPWWDNQNVPKGIWSAFCKDNDGGEGNGQMKTAAGREVVNTDLVDLKPNPRRVTNGRTVTEQYEADFTRASLSISFKWGTQAVPNRANHWRLKDNECWPREIVTEDPGYVLLTDDKWYEDASVDAASLALINSLKAEYRNAPDQARQNLAKLLRPSVIVKRSLDLEIEALLDGDFGVREANSSRRLSDEELASNLDIIECTDRFCKDMLAVLEDDDSVVEIIPGDPMPTLPVDNADSQATQTPTLENPVRLGELVRKTAMKPQQTMVTMVKP